MISKEELRGCLKNAKFEEEQIERILRKKIKTLLAKGKANEIEKILKVLNKEGIKKEVIENCLSVLASGKADEIREYLEKHGAELIQLSQKVAKSFGKRYGLDRFELEDETMDIIVNKCGNLVRNLWTCPQVLDACIFNKTYKYLYARTYNSLKSQSIEILEENRLQKRNNLYTTDDNYEGELEDNVNLRKGGFDDIEQEVMRYMIKLVKEGEAKDIHKKVAEIMEIDEEEIVYIIRNIRQKMIANKLVKTRENGDVEFTI